MAHPYSIHLLGQGTDFVYRDGTLCYLYDGSTRVLNVHDSSRTELVFDLEHVFGPSPNLTGGHSKLLHFQDDILCVLSAAPSEPNRLVAFDTRRLEVEPDARVLFCRDLVKNEYSTCEFVRQGSGHLIFGSYNDSVEIDNYKWQFWAFDLARSRSCELDCGNLSFSTCSINEDILFEVVDNHFYIATTQITRDPEGKDPTSYFGGCRFDLNEETPKALYWKVWRRGHIEGAIHNLWTDFSLMTDENGQLLLLESRREWQVGNMKPTRTFYTQPLPFDSQESLGLMVSEAADLISFESDSRTDDEHDLQWEREGHDTIVCDNQPFDKDDDPSFRCHLPRYTHPEFPSKSDAFEYSNSATKFRTYNPASMAFLDLVVPHVSKSNRLSLRIGSRVPASPLNSSNGLLRKAVVDQASGKVIRGSEESFVDRGVRLWPRDEEVSQVKSLMDIGAMKVKAMADERGVVFNGSSGLVLLNFDPAGEWQTLNTSIEMVEGDRRGKTAASPHGWMRVERAMWMDERWMKLR